MIFGEGSDAPISFCPYCGVEGQDCWLTEEQSHYATAVATDVALGPELKKLERELKRAGGGMFKLSAKTNMPKVPPPPMETDDESLTIYRFPCCHETVKVDRHDKLFCIICGKEMDVTMSEAQMVFLSHKGIDKTLVVDFKETLAALGYDPWIDQDAMPAGTPLERGLLAGMQSSCGVVFFITPAFKDEGYLETEVNYAIQEKRKKGDKFAIITLQFVDSEGNVGAVPELLETYVWKKPTSHLEAVREIVRALPIQAGPIDWREGIEGVVGTPKVKSKSAELSDEAKAILKVAALGSGRIMHIRTMSGEGVQASGRAMIPSQEARVVAQ